MMQAPKRPESMVFKPGTVASIDTSRSLTGSLPFAKLCNACAARLEDGRVFILEGSLQKTLREGTRVMVCMDMVYPIPTSTSDQSTNSKVAIIWSKANPGECLPFMRRVPLSERRN